MLVEAYGEHGLGKSQCFEWFKKFKSGNFDVRNEERGTWNVIYYELLNLAKPLILNATDNKWSIWIKLCVKNDQNIKKGNTK